MPDENTRYEPHKEAVYALCELVANPFSNIAKQQMYVPLS